MVQFYHVIVTLYVINVIFRDLFYFLAKRLKHTSVIEGKKLTIGLSKNKIETFYCFKYIAISHSKNIWCSLFNLVNCKTFNFRAYVVPFLVIPRLVNVTSDGKSSSVMVALNMGIGEATLNHGIEQENVTWIASLSTLVSRGTFNNIIRFISGSFFEKFVALVLPLAILYHTLESLMSSGIVSTRDS